VLAVILILLLVLSNSNAGFNQTLLNTGGQPYPRIQYPRLAEARKKNWKIKEINGS